MDYFSQTTKKSFLRGFLSTKSDNYLFLIKRKVKRGHILSRTPKTSKIFGFCNFQKVEKKTICMIWVNSLSKFFFLFDPWHYQEITSAQLLRKSE